MPSNPPGYVPQAHFIDKCAGELAASLEQDTAASGDAVWSAKTCAKKLNKSPIWLAIGRSRGYGPPFVKLGTRAIGYRPEAVIAWLRSREYHTTKDYPGHDPQKVNRSPGRPRHDAKLVPQATGDAAV